MSDRGHHRVELFEFSFTNRQDAIYAKDELLVDDGSKPKPRHWEDWREGDDVLTSRMDARHVTVGDASFEVPVGAGAATPDTACADPSPQGGRAPSRKAREKVVFFPKVVDRVK